jgi:glutathione peroxidase
MTIRIFCLGVLGLILNSSVVRAVDEPKATDANPFVLDHVVKDIDGKDINLADYKGKTVLLVNVASKCGFTKQYKGLEALYRKYKDRGFVIVGFPANNFNGQEPGTNEEIKQFCTSKYDVTFPMMSKISVKGDDIHPLYRQLTDAAGEVKWNFNKFLVGKDGKLIKHFESKVTPESEELTTAIENALQANPPAPAAPAAQGS